MRISDWSSDVGSSDLIAPTLKRRAPDEREAAALSDLDARLAALPQDAAADAIQSEVFEAGKAAGFEPLRDWFKALYETLLGSSQGSTEERRVGKGGVRTVRSRWSPDH